jgi:hypothetical protein
MVRICHKPPSRRFYPALSRERATVILPADWAGFPRREISITFRLLRKLQFADLGAKLGLSVE